MNRPDEQPNGQQADDLQPVQSEVIQPVASAPATEQPSRQRLRIKPLTVVIAVLLLLGALVVWFLFTAKSVVLQTTPQSSQLSVAGGVQFKIDDHYLLLPGHYRLEAQLPGYYPLNEEIVVDGQQNQVKHFGFKKLPGRLTVSTHPAVTAQVWIDDQLVGRGGEELTHIAAGTHQIKIEAAQYFSHTQQIMIEGKDRHQTLSIVLNPAWADVTLHSVPAAAQLDSNGTTVGLTPFSGRLLQGELQLSLSLAGYKPWQQTIKVEAGTTLALPTVYLHKNDSLLQLNSTPGGASVTLDGNYQGKTPLQLVLSADQGHQLILFKDGYQQAGQTISLPSGETRDLTLKLTPQLGQITIRANHQDALLYVDDRLMGRADQSLTLTVKQHRIVVKKEGFVDYQTTVLPRAALKQVVNVQLKTLEQAKWEKIKRQIVTSTGSRLKLFKPEGVFTMGASRREQGRRANEISRRIALKRPFYLGIKEISNKEYRRFVKLHSSGHVKGNSLNNDSHPVVNISWQQAALFCNWLSAQEKLPLFYQVEGTGEAEQVVAINAAAHGYRLPTEAEWAWSSRFRQGTMLKYGWGDRLPPTSGAGNFADRSGAAILGYIQARYDDKYPVTAPVGSFAANDKGLHDLSGNVAEWISDFYEIKTGLSLQIEKDPLGGESGDYHVIRGASWAHGTMTQLRLSFRDYGNEGRNDVGFRLARFVE